MKQGMISEQVDELIYSQQGEWPLAKENYEALKNVRTKELSFRNFKVRIQFNPARIVSSSAKVDKKSIQDRKCFLCPANLPAVQKGIPFGEEYQILLNPYPIFPFHLTIPIKEHTNQTILSRFNDMLGLAKTLDRFVIFYNGPKCGASAPDHAHFQAGNKGFMPIEKEWKILDKEIICMQPGASIYFLKNYLRNTFVIESNNQECTRQLFNQIYAQLEIPEGDEEPMMNVLAWYESGWWVVCVFPREKHRPSCYWAEGDRNILISPASVDIGGVFITPLEKDYEKITMQDVESILKEVTLSDAKTEIIIENLKGQCYEGTGN